MFQNGLTKEGVVSIKKNKITFDEWLNSSEELGIYCNTKEQSDFLCKQLDKKGKTWATGLSYKEVDYVWEDQKDNNVKDYYSNKGTYGEIDGPYQIAYSLVVYEFNEIDFGVKPSICDWFD